MYLNFDFGIRLIQKVFKTRYSICGLAFISACSFRNLALAVVMRVLFSRFHIVKISYCIFNSRVAFAMLLYFSQCYTNSGYQVVFWLLCYELSGCFFKTRHLGWINFWHERMLIVFSTGFSLLMNHQWLHLCVLKGQAYNVCTVQP